LEEINTTQNIQYTFSNATRSALSEREHNIINVTASANNAKRPRIWPIWWLRNIEKKTFCPRTGDI
jgi:hypothetical protein